MMCILRIMLRINQDEFGQKMKNIHHEPKNTILIKNILVARFQNIL